MNYAELYSDLIYTQESGPIPTDVLFGYFDICMTKLLDQNETDPFVREFLEGGRMLSVSLPEFQKTIMARDCKIEPNYGCAYFGSLPRLFPNDEKVLGGVKRFMYICMRSYVTCLKRAQELRSEPLTSSGPFSNHVCMEFYEASNCLMAMPETKRSLKQIYDELHQLPVQRIKDIQESIFPMLGYETKFAVKCMEESQKTIQTDPMRFRKQQLFLLCCDIALRESTMTLDQRKAYYAKIPTHLHNTPQIFEAFQQHQAQQQMMHQHQNHGHGHEHGSHDSPSLDPAANTHLLRQQQQLMAMLSTPEGQEKMKALSERMNRFKAEAAEKVMGWSEEQRNDFFDQCDKDKVVANMSSVPGPTAAIDTFLSMSDEDLQNIVTLQAAVEADAASGGTLGSKLVQFQQEARSRAGLAPEEGGKSNVFSIGGLVGTLGSMAGAVGGGHDHGHSHSHGHSHDHGSGACQGHPPARSTVTEGHSEMER